MKNVLGLDPGHTTGYCFAEVEGDEIQPRITGQFEYAGRFRFFEKLIVEPDVIVMEDFRLYQSAAQAKVNSTIPTVHVIGLIEYIAWKRKIPLYTQMAYEIKRVSIPDDLHKKFATEHKRDAWKHIRAWAIKDKYGKLSDPVDPRQMR